MSEQEYHANAEAVSLTYLDHALSQIDKKFDNGDMDAFGNEGSHVAKDIEKIRSTQMNMFLQHMSLEMNFPTVAVSYSGRSKEAGVQFQEAFEEKEHEVDELGGKLQHLTELISNINGEAAPGSSTGGDSRH